MMDIGEAIEKAWKNTIIKVEKQNASLSSEKTLVFLFAWELKRILPEVIIDFEYAAFKGQEKAKFEACTSEIMRTKDTFLDLLVYLDKSYKVALEFKIPKSPRKGSSSDKTGTRVKINKDIMRLNYLVTHSIDQIQKGYFLCGTNEPSYLNFGNYKRLLGYRVHHRHVIGPISSKKYFPQYPPLTHPIPFKWKNIYRLSDGTYKIKGKFAWLLMKIEK